MRRSSEMIVRCVRAFAGLLAAGLLALMLAGAASAQDDPLLREQIKVYDDLVTLGDLFENAGSTARAPVFRSPELGTRGIVAAKRVAAAARQHGLEWRNPGEIDEVSVHRPSRVVTLDEVRNAIARHVSGEGEDWTVVLSRGAKSFHIDPRVKASIAIKYLDLQPQAGRFRAVVSIDGAEQPVREKTFTGRAYPSVAAIVPIRVIERGATIAADDVKTVRLPRSRVANSAHKEVDEVIGMAAKKQLMLDRPILRGDIEPPKLVKRNGMITIVYRSQGLVLKTKGRALGDGASGEMVPIINVQTKRTIEAEVTGTGVVSVSTSRTPPKRTASTVTQRSGGGRNSFVVR